MTLRSAGLNAMDFDNMTLPDLYLRYCIEYQAVKDAKDVR